MSAEHAVPNWPSVSVIMPVRNEARTIEAAVRSVLSQEYPRPFTLVVADGMSTDGTRERLAALAAEHEPRLRVVDNPAGTTPQALNAAIRASDGEVVVRCDAHAVLPQGYIKRAVEILVATGADNVGGIQHAVGRTPVQRSIAIAMSSPVGVGNARFHLGGPPGPVDTVFLGVFRRAALERVGLFDERLLRNQDSELNYRLRATGGVVYFHPDLKVAYEPRSSLRALWRQYWFSGVWKRETFRAQPRALRPRQAAPPALVVALAASLVLAFTPFWRLALVVPVLYGALLVGAAAWFTVKRRDAAATLLMVVLPAMHIAWGSGFLWGRSGVRSR